MASLRYYPHRNCFITSCCTICCGFNAICAISRPRLSSVGTRYASMFRQNLQHLSLSDQEHMHIAVLCPSICFTSMQSDVSIRCEQHCPFRSMYRHMILGAEYISFFLPSALCKNIQHSFSIHKTQLHITYIQDINTVIHLPTTSHIMTKGTRVGANGLYQPQSYTNGHVYIMDDPGPNAPQTEVMGMSRPSAHSFKCDAVRNLFTKYSDFEVHEVAFKSGKKGKDVFKYWENELKSKTNKDLLIIFFHGTAGERGEDYKWYTRNHEADRCMLTCLQDIQATPQNVHQCLQPHRDDHEQPSSLPLLARLLHTDRNQREVAQRSRSQRDHDPSRASAG